MAIRTLFLVWLLLLSATQKSFSQKIIPGAENTREYLPLLAGKRVALLINQTSQVGNRLLADTMLKRGVRIVKIFVPEHGFRGVGDAGAHIANGRDSATGLPIISLYGKNKKPTKEQLKDVDVVVYDIQDVGVRFYTYISTLQYMMEACAESGKRLMILDRPNPNGHYVDGPVLDTGFRSFIGMQPIPIVYAMTPGEYARMLVGERWFKGANKLKYQVIKATNWDHNSRYRLPVAPSPNLRSMEAIYLYPSVCLFEGTTVSVGRGTDKPFQQWGHPALKGLFGDSFTPLPTTGASNPPFNGETCYGRIATLEDVRAASQGIQIGWLVEMYQKLPDTAKFWPSGNFITLLMGGNKIYDQLKRNMNAEEIRASWQPGLTAFKAKRKKYLLYKDFE
jgi:uncharacterized protein YbbC (DUF1343 family)